MACLRWLPTRLRQRRFEQRQHPAPGFFRLIVVIDARVGRAPAVNGTGVHLDLGGQLRRGECLTRSEEHTSDSSHEWISYAVFCLKKKKKKKKQQTNNTHKNK